MSMPFISGMSTSETIHVLFAAASEDRKQLADEKIRTLAPSERTKLPIDNRTDSSLSTMDTRMLLKSSPRSEGQRRKLIETVPSLIDYLFNLSQGAF